MKIAVDIDEVLGEWMREFLRWYNHEYGTNWRYADVTDYRWPVFTGDSSGKAIEDVYKFHKMDSFRHLPLVNGAEEAITELVKHHELYAVTGRQNVTREITHQWIQQNFPGVFKGIELANNYPKDGSATLAKGKICEELGCEVLIDDDTRHVESLMKHGIRVIVFNKPWNIYHRLPDSIMRADNWPEIVEHINQLVTV
ncbi:TPA: hypothetical protein DHW58_00830 [Patescibacteria group bacterium]|uniref:Nucleotidase n=2 Tax=Bacteria division Kazan-3B-28 TaxID=1798534 RepID=A0A0G1ZH66_UNCK3|nr:MAG: hypothetical protein VE98_C0001G0005 [candidate division Kazan bacterium GW2011_GWA1_50_15]KKW25713.1 MAG: hypothetical protein VE99_C0001G0352 [candidate division Kazan bacterium GW2011_GWC1_52_13]KKW27272.1 MAG: hypothetical protein VF00_C0001G0207 [candidate division Kazan bacterium GW2011_GWB1_52_7]HAV65997.1 hypothetical protein [Patescibacteria group bacterium]HCL47516.1 hypothetical protein [Patescibacteria group bacterium]